MTTRGEINSNFYQIVNVDANGAPTSVKSEYLPNVGNANYAANAGHANIADVANSVSVANVVGIGNIATLNLTGSSSNVLYGNGVFAPASGTGANANYANFAGTAFNVSIGNVSGLGNIASINLSGNGSQTLLGNGVWGALPNTANANFANFAGTAFSVSGSNVTGIVGNATHANFADVANLVAGANVTGIVGNATHANIADLANSVAGANVTGTVALATHANVADLANSVAGANVTGTVGNATHATVADSANSVSGANVTGQVANALVASTVYSNNQPNITTLGTLTTLSVADSIYASGNVSGAYILGDGSYLTGIGNLSAANGYWGSFYSNVSQNIASITTAYAITLNNTDPNSNGVTIASNSHVKFTYAGTYNIQFSAQLINQNTSTHEASFWIRKNGTDVPDTRGLIAVPGKQGAINGQVLPAWNYILKLAANDYVEFYWQAETTDISIENLPAGTTPTTPAAPSMIVTAQQVTNVQPVELQGAMTGNIFGNSYGLYNLLEVQSLGDITGNLFVGNGSSLYGLAGANVTGIVGNATHANIADLANSVAGANVTGIVGNATHANVADLANSVAGSNVSGQVGNALIAGTVYTNAQPNITSVGSLTSLTVTGNITSGNISGGNLVSANFFTGDGGLLSNISFSGNVSNANYSNFAGTAYSVSGSNVSGQVSNALVAGTVYTNAQPNITSVGTLIDLNVEGNIFTNTAVYVGNTSNATGLTNPTIVAKASGATFVQIALVNGSANGSADLVAYGDNGSDSGAFVDVGFTSSAFDDPLYTITKPNDGYMFVQGDDSSANGGNLVIATGAQGSTKDIIFATGGFLEADEKMRYSHSLGQLYIQPNTAATDTTTGALRVGGGAGIAGDVYAGNVVSANFFLGDGGLLSNITITGNVAYANYANYAGEAFNVAGSNVTGTVADATNAGTANNIRVTSTSYPATGYVMFGSSTANGFAANPYVTSGISANLTTNTVTANTFVSTVATGTAPFTVTSQTVVPNLRANSALYTSVTPTSGSQIYYPMFAIGSGATTAFINTSTSTGLQWDNSTADGTLISPEFQGRLVGSSGSTTYINPTTSSIDIRISGSSRLFVGSVGANVTGNVNATTSINAPRFVSNVATGTAPFTVTSTTRVANLNVATAGVADTVAGANVTGVVANATFATTAGSATTATTAATVTTNAQPNITSVGTLTSLNVTGTTTTGGATVTGGAVLIENGGANSGTLSVDGVGNANVFATIVGNVIIGSGTSTAIMGNLVTANYFSGNGSLLTGITATATPGGANTELQFNNAGSMGGISTVTYDGINLSLGAIGNVKITGGTTGQVISTDGAGNLSFVAQSGGGGGTDFTPSFLLGGM